MMMKQFITCGTVGWCLEILFTAASSVKERNFQLKGNTSLWMFPIYGMAVFLLPLTKLLKGKPVFLRGSIYTVAIFITEFTTGRLLKIKNLCPWNYEKARLNVEGVIRLDYAPYWFGTGLLFEYLLNRR